MAEASPEPIPDPANAPAVAVRLTAGPLGDAAPWRVAGCGAVVTFDGVVRPGEPRPGGGKGELSALLYESYEPMTTRELTALAAAVAAETGAAALDVEHSIGRVPVGRCSFRLRVAAAHRAEALACCTAFIDRMKRDVPLWKIPVWKEDAGASGGR